MCDCEGPCELLGLAGMRDYGIGSAGGTLGTALLLAAAHKGGLTGDERRAVAEGWRLGRQWEEERRVEAMAGQRVTDDDIPF